MASPVWLRCAGLLALLAMATGTAGCGLAMAAAASALQDELDGGGGSDPRPDVLVVHALPSASHVDDIVAKLDATEFFDKVRPFDASSATPTAIQLLSYEAVLVVADGAFHDPTALGNLLASYSDGGSGVVTATLARPGGSITGAWAAQDYHAILGVGVLAGDGPIGWTVDAPLHPVMAGLVFLGGGTGSDRPDAAALTAGSGSLATWTTGEPAAAVRLTAAGRRVVDLAFHPVTDAVDPSFVPASSDMPMVVARALAWAAGAL